MADRQERLLEQVRRARGDFEASQDEVEKRKNDYFQAVRQLHEEGMPLREIASALGLSHQRVHQMVDEATGRKSSRMGVRARRAAQQGGLLIFVALLLLGSYAAGRDAWFRPTSEARGPSKGVTQAPSPNVNVPLCLEAAARELLESPAGTEPRKIRCERPLEAQIEQMLDRIKRQREALESRLRRSMESDVRSLQASA